MSNQLQVSGEAKIRTIQGPVVANSGVITALNGDASEYVRGDGTLADFPTSTGGGSSVSYYLNTSVSQGTIGGVAYKQLSKVPISGAGTDVTISANGYIASYITDANDPALLEVPAGNFNCEFYFSVNSNAHNPYVYAEVYKYDGTTFTLLGSNVSIPQYLSNGTTLSPYYFAIAVSTAVLTVTDRIAIRIYVNVDGRTVTLHTENNHLCQVVTTFSKGLISLNNLTRQNQFFATGTSGTDFNISSATATHTFNIPDASASARGLITTGSQTIAGAKTFTSASRNESGILLKNGVTTGSNGYVSVGSNSAGLTIGVHNSGTTYYHELLMPNSASYNYTFPAFSGTMALLEGSQTFSGLKTFSSSPISDGGYSFKILASGTPFQNGYSVISSLSGNVSITQAISAGNLKSFTFDFSSWPTNTFYTYTLPASDGTIALTSNLSSYVPYTGATTNVTLGTNTLTAATLIVDQGTTGTTLRFKQYGSASYNTNGYTDIYAVSNNIVGFGLNQGSGNFKGFTFNVVNVTSNQSRDLYIPDATGTIALLSGTQTFTGATTFSSNITVNSVQVGNAGNGSNVKLGGSTLGAITTGSNNIAIGTSALTSLTTSNANIGIGNSALASVVDGAFNTAIGFGIGGSITSGSNNALFGYGAGSSITTGNYNTIIGAYAGTAGMSNNIVLADGAGTIRYQWNGTNNVFGNPISGTSATFSSAVSLFSSTLSFASSLYPIQFGARNSIYSDGSGNLLINNNVYFNGTNNVYAVNGIAQRIYFDNTGGMNFQMASSGTAGNAVTFTTPLAIASTGAATFSSSVTATQFLIGGTPSNTAGFTNSFYAESAFPSLILKNTSGTVSSISIGLASAGAFGIWNNITSSYFMFFTAAGNAGIGTSSPLNLGSATNTVITVNAATGNTAAYALTINNVEQGYISTQSSSMAIVNSANTPMIFATNNAEKMRITSGGYLKASPNGTYYSSTGTFSEFCNNTTNTPALYVSQTSTSFIDNSLFVEGYTNTTNNTWYLISGYNRTTAAYKFRVADSGNVTNTNGSYGTISSDRRLKENIVSATPKLDDIMKLNVVNFNLIGNEEKHIGFIAQEMKEVFPSFVYQTDTREYDEDGNITKGLEDALGVKTGMEFAILVKAIQEQNQIITSLQDRLDKAGL